MKRLAALLFVIGAIAMSVAAQPAGSGSTVSPLARGVYIFDDGELVGIHSYPDGAEVAIQIVGNPVIQQQQGVTYVYLQFGDGESDFVNAYVDTNGGTK